MREQCSTSVQGNLLEGRPGFVIFVIIRQIYRGHQASFQRQGSKINKKRDDVNKVFSFLNIQPTLPGENFAILKILTYIF